MKSLPDLSPEQRCIEAVREVLGKVPLYTDPTGRAALGDTEQQELHRFYIEPYRTGGPRSGLDGRVPPRGSGA